MSLDVAIKQQWARYTVWVGFKPIGSLLVYPNGRVSAYRNPIEEQNHDCHVGTHPSLTHAVNALLQDRDYTSGSKPKIRIDAVMRANGGRQ